LVSAGTYNVIQDFGTTEEAHGGYLSMDPYWVMAVIRLGMPLSFSRKKLGSITKDVSLGALTRAVKPLVITDDCIQLTVQNSKRSHTKSMNASLKQTDVNYLVEVLPGDWIFAWIVNNRRDFESLLNRIETVHNDNAKPCNGFNDGLKFVGRVHNVRKQVQVERAGGTKVAGYTLQCTGFSELDTQFFYDNSLASKDAIAQDLGQWMARLGLDYEKLFRDNAEKGVKENNVNEIVPTLLDLIVGRGPSKAGNITVAGSGGKTATATPSLATDAPFAYLVPLQVGKLLGVQSGTKADRVMSYADVLELLQGVQHYPSKEGFQLFVPGLSKDSTPRRRKTTVEMLGTFLPFFPELTNQPLWSILNRYLNPTVNEMYTCLRVNPDGNVMPTVVMRQIPFTTEAFTPDATNPGSTATAGAINYTKFLELPRWVIPATMIHSVDIGRSDATRFNFVHVYGQSAYTANNNPIPFQIVQNPPIRDDLDIMRSGLRSYMTTVECFVSDQIGQVPTTWMKLIADWTIGSHLTLNGTISSVGIQAPICEGDNLEFDGVVYHLEGVSHSAGIGMNGGKSWTTSLQLTNGMRAQDGDVGFTDEQGAASGQFPIYPGFDRTDNIFYDPGLSLDQRLTTGGETVRDTASGFDEQDNLIARSEAPSPLNPANETTGDAPPSKKTPRRRRARRT
jgi:hypothetical protein